MAIDLAYEFNARRLRQDNLIKREAAHIEKERALRRIRANLQNHNNAIQLYTLHEHFSRLAPEVQHSAVRRMRALASSMKNFRQKYPEGRTSYPLPKKEY